MTTTGSSLMRQTREWRRRRGESATGRPRAGARGLLSAIVTDMRVEPGRLRRQQIDTPLHTTPTDMTFVALLARSVACGSQSRCEVAFAARPDRARIAAILDAHPKVALR